MTSSRSSPGRAGAAAILPLALLLLGALVANRSAGVPTPAGGDVALAATVLSVVVAALVSGLSFWLTDVLVRFLLAACGGATAAGSTYLLLGQLTLVPWLSVPLAAIAGVAWARRVAAVFALVRPSRQVLIDQIPERDRIGRQGSRGRLTGSVRHDVWSVDVSSPRMQRLVVFGVLVFGAAVALSWGSAPLWWILVLVVVGLAFCLVMAAWSAVRVDVGRRGLTVTSLRLPVPLVLVRPEDVLGVGSTEVDPMVWGGWGLRWTARYTAYIRSGGPGIIVHRSSGRPLVIEIPAGTSTADAGAALLREVARGSQPV